MSRLILRRARAFRKVFGVPGSRTKEQEIVLAVLGRFCRANKSSVTVSPIHRQVDPLATCVAEGRREVLNRISDYIQLDQEELIRIINEAEKTDV
ncbi:GTP-binding protein [Klebsiella oxytoca]|uniref:Bbp19 family protein n=1 Tax=Klebsiella oxytoca TaxID=571 RepID=UPI001CCD0FD2|nr:GTP-binding protein [Klebsiella oxytoca]MBZ7165180.1 GTP-binding protein [Klebsiella oxytoca]HEJ9371212.1 GTP-binding protein [Klebsiella oxytoca]